MQLELSPKVVARSTRGSRKTARARGIGVRATRRRVALPLPKAHFRVFLGEQEVGVQSVSPLHWLEGEPADPEVRQTVTLRRAVGPDRTLYAWRAASAAGKRAPSDVTIVQLGAAGGEPVNIWRLEKARPVRWSGPDFDARSNDLAFEELEIAYESIAWRGSV